MVNGSGFIIIRIPARDFIMRNAVMVKFSLDLKEQRN